MSLVVGIDASTTAVKAIAWRADGSVAGEGRAPIALDNPEPDAWQQDATSWWQALCAACSLLCAQIDPQQVQALCVTNQRETFVVTDENGTPLHPALVWMDARAGAQVDEAVAALGRDVLHHTSGKPPCTTPSLYKLMYLLEREPRLCAGNTRVLDVHGYLSWKLTGRFATSLASADPTGMIDMQARSWSPALLSLVSLDEALLPALVEPGAALGELSLEAARATGLPPGIAVVAGAGDGQAAGLGAGIVDGGARGYLNLGTAVVMGVLSPSYRCDDAFRTLYAASGGYFLESDLQGGTFTLTWLIDRWLRQRDSERSFEAILSELEERATSIARGADGLLLMPYWNGVMNPFWDDAASGAVIGWRGSHGPAHLYRAILEGIALEQRLVTIGIEAARGPIEELVVMGGGSKSALWCQILADVLDKRIVRAGSSEATALGAGILAAAHVGMHPSISAAASAMTAADGASFTPSDEGRAFYAALYREVYSGLYEALRGRLSALWRLRTGAKA